MLFEDVEVDGALAIDAGLGIGLAFTFDELAHVTQGQRQTIAPRHHHLLKLFGVAHAAFHTQQGVLCAVAEQAHGLVGIGFTQGGGDLGRCHAVRTQPGGVEVNAHLTHCQAVDVDPRNPFHPLQAFANEGVADDGQLPRAARFAQQRQVHHGLGVFIVEARERGRTHITRQVGLHSGHTVAQLLHGARHVGVQTKLHGHRALAFTTARGNALDTGHAVHRLFIGLDDFTLNGFR